RRQSPSGAAPAMVMKKSVPAADPDAYVEELQGWQRECVERLRAAVVSAKKLEEVVKWGHLVYLYNGPVLLIRAEEERVLFGFWRGQRLRALEPGLKPGGKYEMATLELREGMKIAAARARALVREAVALNETLGDPTRLAK
ncbi:MAG: DUF1801 domain-containing protein, partial [Pseudoxanthomonas sp.]